MSDFLDEMASSSRARVAEARDMTPESEMRRAAESSAPARELKFGDRLEVIAEIKRAAPSTGTLRTDVNLTNRAKAYESASAAAVSVLTEPSRFLGKLSDLREVREATSLPVMRKDFLVEPFQVYEARANGADGVLLIAAILDDDTLNEMREVAAYLGMFSLIEAFDERDIERAQGAGAEIIGVNCRNLRDLSVEFDRFQRLRGNIDADRVAVAESGITTPEEFSRVEQLGYDAVLIGSALMRESNPGATLAKLRGSTQETAK